MQARDHRAVRPVHERVVRGGSDPDRHDFLTLVRGEQPPDLERDAGVEPLLEGLVVAHHPLENVVDLEELHPVELVRDRGHRKNLHQNMFAGRLPAPGWPMA
jgi:hypothetical protein